MAGKRFVWRKRLLGAIAWGMVVSTGAMTAMPSWASGAAPAAVAQKVEGHEALWSRLAGRPGEGVPVIVRFAMPPVPDAASFASPQAADEAQTSAIRAMQQKVLGAVLPAGVLSSPAASEGKNIKLMDFSPMFAITATAEELASLAADPNVTAIVEDRPQPPLLRDSLSLIQMPQMYAAGATGNGYHVAVLDTGGRRGHVFLSSRITSEACYSTTNNAEGSVSLCPGGVSSSTATGSGEDCTASNVSGCGHGTHVAGTVAGWNTSPQSGQPTSGVARDARLISINVFSRFPASTCGLPTACVMTYPSDQIRGLERVYALRSTYRIAAVNMSLGGGEITSRCDSDPRKPIIDQLKAVRIATVIAAGNDGFDSAVAAPGCISSAVTVGSSTKWDGRSSFSNWGNLIDVVAPGSDIYSSYINGSSNNYFDYSSGTSMASPHVAGAFATLRQAFPNATVDQIENALKSTGTGISSAGVTKPRINVNSARIVLGGGTPPPPPGAPANDNFVNRITIAPAAAGATRTVTGTNVRATAENGEPIHAGFERSRNSVWWRFTPASSGPITIDTLGSRREDGYDLDTVLSVYRGSSVSSLTLVAENDDADYMTVQSRVTFNGVAGTQYQIAVVGWAGLGYPAQEGAITLNVQGGSAVPSNDNFANASTISVLPAPGAVRGLTGANGGATAESGEPNHAGVATARNSVWWRFRPSTSGQMTISTVGSSFDTVLAVYTGNSVGALTLVASNNDISGTVRESRVTFNATAGTLYRFAIAGVGNASGSIKINLRGGGGGSGGTPAPANDNLASASTISVLPAPGAVRAVTGSNAGATAESGEPNHAGVATARNSVWWRFRPSSSGPMTISTVESSFDTVLAVYTGSSMGSLNLIASNNDISASVRQSRITFNPTPGTLYVVAVAGVGNASGSIKLNMRGGGASSSGLSLAAASLANPAAAGSSNALTGTSSTLAGSLPTSQAATLPDAGQKPRMASASAGVPAGVVAAPFGDKAAAIAGNGAPALPGGEPVRLMSTVVTKSNDGVLRVPADGDGIAVLAVTNSGARATLTASLSLATQDGTATQLPVGLSICRTDADTGDCIGARGPTVTFTADTGELVTFAAFVSHKQTDVPLDAAPAGLIVNFTSNGETVATTTTPICTEVAGTCQARQEAHLR